MANVLGIALFLALLSADNFCSAYLDQQLAWHREYGLPRVPPQASLVWYVTEPTTSYQLRDGVRKKVVEPGSPGLGFSLDGRTILYGAGKSEPVASITYVKPDPSLVHDDVYIHWLDLAIACHERGWKPMAIAALRRWVLTNGWDTEENIARFAWHHWEQRISDDPGTPLPLIAKYLKRALPLGGLDNASNRALLRSVELAAQPRNSPPGSDDALIDELVSAQGAQPSPYQWARGWRHEPRHRAIVRRGLGIVPALIAHLDDDRITRADARPAWQRNGEHARVRDAVFEILVDLHGGPFAVTEDTRDERLAAIGKWFADANKLGEEKYVVSQVLGDNEDADGFRSTMFWLLTEKYPQRLPDVFRTLIDTRRNQHGCAWTFASAVAEAPVPPDDKRKVLEHAAMQSHPWLRAAGIHHLRAVDPKRAKELLLADLAKLPEHLGDSEAWLARVVAEGTDPDEWSALGRAVRCADVRGRILLIQEVGRSTAPAGWKHRRAFFTEYLTDDADYEGPPHYVWFSKVEVRHFATVHLARMLELECEFPDNDWTAAQWAELRAKVRAKVTKQLRP